MHRRRSAVFIKRSARLRAPCPPFTSLTAGVLTCTHLARLLKKPRLREAFMAFPAGVLACARLARRSLPLLRECSLSRTLPAAYYTCGGGAHFHAPCPPLTTLAAGVLTFTHLARREKRTDLSVLYGACSAVLTITRLKKRTQSGAFLRFHGVPGGSRTHDLSLRRRTLYPTELRKHLIWRRLLYNKPAGKASKITAVSAFCAFLKKLPQNCWTNPP